LGILAAWIFQRCCSGCACAGGCAGTGDARCGARADRTDHQRRLPEDEELLLIPELLPELLLEDEP
jgi:hypothetical protein